MAPYIEHDDANTNLETPASLAARARSIVASKLIAYVKLGRQVPERVVGQRSEVHNSVEPLERLSTHLTHVTIDGRRESLARAEIATPVEERVEAGHLVPGTGQHRC